MILAGNANIFMYGLRVIMGAIDSVVYWLLVHVVNLLSDIARTNIFSDDTIATFSNRIYFIMGTIMFFKMAISIVHYIIDPDKLTDSKSGFASIIKNTIVALVLVVVVPIAFRYAMYAQEAILQDDTIGRLIVGRTGGTQNNVGDTIATNILSGFVHPDEKIVGDECNSLGYSGDCEAKLRDYSNDLADSYKYVDQDARIGEGASATSPYGYTYLLDMATSAETAKDGGNKNYVITYQFVLSTLAGGFAVYIFLLFCIDIAVRTVKLAFLRIIAPIPIATYIDEKGKSMFNNWRKACFSTYFDLFVRLAAVQFGIFMITTFVGSLNDHQICSQNFVNGHLIPTNECHQPGIFVEIFIILGVLLFIKELPKMIEQITGIKLDGKFELNPMKKMASVPLAGQLAARTIGGIDSAVAGRGFANGWKTGGKAVPLMGGSKTLAELTPYRAETLKNRQTGRQELEYRREKEHDGEKLYSDYRSAVQAYNAGELVDKPDKDEYLMNHFKNEEFKNSYKKMSAAKGEMYKAQNDLAQAQADLNAAMASGDQNRIAAARDAYDKKKKAEGTMTSQYEVAKADHESMRKIYADDASRQDMFDYIDKTKPEIVESRITSQPSAQTTSSGPTVGGVPVTGTADGEKTTASGIVVPETVKFDK